jgi:A/G-specific adenine glycosylase
MTDIQPSNKTRPIPAPTTEVARAYRQDISTFQHRLLAWFADCGRTFSWRTEGLGSYEVIVAEVLLQRTTATTVARLLPDFLHRFPEWESITSAPDNELADALRPFGLWKRRLATLKPLAARMVELDDSIPNTREAIEDLPGVGQYIANAVLLVCHGKAEPLLDVNMVRVLERYFEPRTRADIRYDPYLQTLSRRILEGVDPKVMNWAVLDFAALVCRARAPRCPECPLAASCRYARESRI